jgi:protein required for attachment to host cells
MQTKTYVLIADGARARLFVTDKGREGLRPALDQEFIGTNLRSREIGSDRPGRAFDSAGYGRHAMEPPTDPHRHEERAFAHEVAGVIEQALRRGEFQNLVVVAPPKALGDLRAEFSGELRKRVTAELPKDLTKVPVHELPRHLRDVI